MKGVLFKKKEGAGKTNGSNGRSLFDANYKLYMESYFREMLYLERRRAERSKKPFLLMLVNLGNTPDKENHIDFTRRLTNSLNSTTREIDLKGWYADNQIIGIIFFDRSSKDIDLINEKVLGGFNRSGVLDSNLYNKVTISYHPFPEETEEEKADDIEFDSELYPDLGERDAANKQSFYLKRGIDILGSIVAIIIFFPVFIVVPIIIKLTSKGPVFFRQKRIGAFGKTFTFLKFRSMQIDNDTSIHANYVKKLILEQKAYDDGDGDSGEKTYKIKNDPRVTPIGRFLRKTSLDEVPQFINVLVGNMSLVGPRPPIPYELQNYDLWHLRRVLEFKPGITGLWQVKGRSRTTFNEMVRMDINYINRWSLWLDIKLMVMTPFSVLSSSGAH